MKPKSYLTFIFIALFAVSYGQNPNSPSQYNYIYNPSPYRYFPVSTERFASFIKEKNIDIVSITRKNLTKNGKVKLMKYSQTIHFDVKSGTVMMVEGFKRGKKAYTRLYTRDDYQRISSVVAINKKGEIESTQIRVLNKDSRESEYYKISGEGDTILATSTGAITDLEATDFYFKKGKLKYQWFNEYYPDLNRKRTTLYKRNGKVKYVWDYQCEPEGKEVIKHKDTSTICKSKSIEENGDTTYITHQIGVDGKPHKHITKRNKYGKLYFSKHTKGVDDIVQSEWMYYYRNGIEQAGLKYKTYHKGKLKTFSHTTYDSEGNETAKVFEQYKKGEVKTKKIVRYEYDDLNRPVQWESIDKISGEKQIAHLTYE